jgi:hypothetical protein
MHPEAEVQKRPLLDRSVLFTTTSVFRVHRTAHQGARKGHFKELGRQFRELFPFVETLTPSRTSSLG